MPRVHFSGQAARRFTGGATELEVEANNFRRMVLELDRRFPGLGRQIEESMAVAIDGEIFQEACLARPNPDSEIYLKLLVAGLRYVSEASFLRHTEFAQAGEINVFIQRAHFGWPQISCAPHIGER